MLSELIFNFYDAVRRNLGIYDDSRFSVRLEDLVQECSIQEFGKQDFFSPPFKIRIKPDDEIWSYHRHEGPLSGSMGLALVRRGKIIGQLETIVN
jgi:hypothetical protein